MSNEGSLLSHIAGNFISQYENVANSSVAYLLNRYPACRRALARLIDVNHVPANYVTELSTGENGRPDISGIDVDGKRTVIIEGKFWANLTNNQPQNYLKELEENGMLLFLAPEARRESLVAEISKRLDGEDDRVLVQSWLSSLDLMERENSKDHDGDLASDLLQLRSLCEQMDQEGMPPLSTEDLDPMHGRICYQLAELLTDCNHLLRNWQDADLSRSRFAGFLFGIGFFFNAFGMECWLGFQSGDWWTRPSHTPIWLQLSAKTDSLTQDAIYCILNDYDPDNTYQNGNRTEYGIILKPGMDRGLAVEFIVSEVKAVLTLVHEKSEHKEEYPLQEDDSHV